MQDADPLSLFDERSEGDATAQQPGEGLQQASQHELGIEEHPGDPASSTPPAPALRENDEPEAAGRELTHSESGEGAIPIPICVTDCVSNLPVKSLSTLVKSLSTLLSMRETLQWLRSIFPSPTLLNICNIFGNIPGKDTQICQSSYLEL